MAAKQAADAFWGAYVNAEPSTVGVCIPTYNEEDTISVLVALLRVRGYRVFVVDGGSTDDTVLLAYGEGALVQTTAQRRPIGPCLRDGWRMALGAGCQHIVQMDAGGSHAVEDLQRLLATRADVVIGSRFVAGSLYEGRPWRAVLSRIAGIMCNLAQSGPWVGDWTSGYRVYSAAAVRELLAHHYLADMHGFQIESLAYARRAGLGVVEVPITYRAGRSSFGWSVAHEAILTWLHVMHNVGSLHR